MGARELKTRLGTYLRRVSKGTTLVVTDRGRPVAELRPIDAESATDRTLAKLAAVGLVTRPRERHLASFRLIASRGESLAKAVSEDRDDRF